MLFLNILSALAGGHMAIAVHANLATLRGKGRLASNEAQIPGGGRAYMPQAGYWQRQPWRVAAAWEAQRNALRAAARLLHGRHAESQGLGRMHSRSWADDEEEGEKDSIGSDAAATIWESGGADDVEEAEEDSIGSDAADTFWESGDGLAAMHQAGSVDEPQPAGIPELPPARIPELPPAGSPNLGGVVPAPGGPWIAGSPGLGGSVLAPGGHWTWVPDEQPTSTRAPPPGIDIRIESPTAPPAPAPREPVFVMAPPAPVLAPAPVPAPVKPRADPLPFQTPAYQAAEAELAGGMTQKSWAGGRQHAPAARASGPGRDRGFWD